MVTKNGGGRSKYRMRKQIPRENQHLIDRLVFLFQPLLVGTHVYDVGDVVECESTEQALKLEKNRAGYILENAPIISDVLKENPDDEFAELYADFLNICKNLPDEYHTANYRQWSKSFWAPCDDQHKAYGIEFIHYDLDTGEPIPDQPKRKPRKKKTTPNT